MKVGLNICCCLKEAIEGGTCARSVWLTVHEGCTSCNLRRSTGRQAPIEGGGHSLRGFNDSRSIKIDSVLRTLRWSTFHWFIEPTTWHGESGILARPPRTHLGLRSLCSTSKSWRYCRKMIHVSVQQNSPACFGLHFKSVTLRVQIIWIVTCWVGNSRVTRYAWGLVRVGWLALSNWLHGLSSTILYSLCFIITMPPVPG